MHRCTDMQQQSQNNFLKFIWWWLVGWCKKDDIAREVLKYGLILHTRGVKATTRRRPTVTSDLNPGPNRMVTPKISNATSMKPTKKLQEYMCVYTFGMKGFRILILSVPSTRVSERTVLSPSGEGQPCTLGGGPPPSEGEAQTSTPCCSAIDGSSGW